MAVYEFRRIYNKKLYIYNLYNKQIIGKVTGKKQQLCELQRKVFDCVIVRSVVSV